MRASSGLIMALNIAYEERETRGFIELNLVTLAFTIGFVLAGLGLIVVSSMLVAMEALLAGQPIVLIWIARGIIWLMAGAAMSFLVAITFRYAPDRSRAKWIWICLLYTSQCPACRERRDLRTRLRRCRDHQRRQRRMGARHAAPARGSVPDHPPGRGRDRRARRRSP